MRFQDINRNPSSRILQQFGWLAAVIFMGLAAYHYGVHERHLLGATLAVLGLLFGIVGTIKPTWLGPVFVTWMIIAFPIGWIISHLILLLIFYGCFLPLGLILRLWRYDPLRLKRPEHSTYWQDCSSIKDIRRYLKQY
jgi:hypothetical protein